MRNAIINNANAELKTIFRKVKNFLTRNGKSANEQNKSGRLDKKILGKKEILDFHLQTIQNRLIEFERNLKHKAYKLLVMQIAKFNLYKIFPNLAKYVFKVSFMFYLYIAYDAVKEIIKVLRKREDFHEFFVEKLNKLIPEESKRSFAVLIRSKYEMEMEFTSNFLKRMFNSDEIIFYVKRLITEKHNNKYFARLFKFFSKFNEKFAVYFFLKILT